MNKRLGLILSCFLAFNINSQAQIAYPGPKPGKAKFKSSKEFIRLENKAVGIQWIVKDKTIRIGYFEDKATHRKVVPAEMPLFRLVLKNGHSLTSNDFTLKASPSSKNIKAVPDALKYSDRLEGKKITADFISKNQKISLHWEAILKNGSNYIRQVFTFSPADSLFINKICLIELQRDNEIKKLGTVDGSPLVDGNMFFALEHPMSQVEENATTISAFLPRLDPILPSHSFTASTVFGTTPQGQLRRGFLYYTERERATPYHQMLHYNSWYDLSWTDRKLDEKSCIDRIQTFADSLIIKRKVPMKAFLFDDGWDNNQTLWQFNKNFPNGFAKLAQVAGKYNADLGLWISPWGGYLEDQKQRLEYGRKQNPPFETNDHGFSLSGPVYYQRFKEVTSKFVTQYNVSLFKFDGVGAGNGASGASITYQKDIEALLKLIDELRQLKPNLYFSLTVGTWPSVYWLNYGDVIWRAGKDTHTMGAGSTRQQWITYRDAEAYKNIVKRAPLYPLNALMYHGICIAENGPPVKFGMDDKDIADEIWSFFGNGTSLQELYINPHKLSAKNWNTLAAAATWSQKNADVLPDVHWIGGDPAKEEVYGYAAWSPSKAVLSLRNPSAEKKTFTVNAAEVFELPEAFRKKDYAFYNARKEQEKTPVAKGKSFTVTLEPFEVKVFDVRED